MLSRTLDVIAALIVGTLIVGAVGFVVWGFVSTIHRPGHPGETFAILAAIAVVAWAFGRVTR